MKLKRNIQVLGVLAAVLAFSAMAVASAQAASPRITVNGVTPTSGNFPFTATSTGSAGGTGNGKLETSLLALTNPKGGCSVTGNLAGSAANTPATGNNIVLTCKEIAVEGFETVCEVNGKIPGEVVTNTLTAKAVYLAATGDTYGVVFSPPASGIFAKFAITGSKCPLAGVTLEIKGTIVASVETPNTDKTTQALEFPTPAITKVFEGTTARKELAVGLSIFGEPAQFTNTFDVTLTSGQSFGVETG